MTEEGAGRLVGEIAAKLAELTDDVFSDVWARPGLSPSDRSLITVAALPALEPSGRSAPASVALPFLDAGGRLG